MPLTQPLPRRAADPAAPGLQGKALDFLYGTAFGRFLLKPLVHPAVSRLGGWFLSLGISKLFIGPFIRANKIDMSQYEPQVYRSYNDFFTRRIRPGARSVDMNPGHFVSPCDSKLTALPISDDCRFTLKHTAYTVSSLLRDEDLAAQYRDGWALIFRLTVDDYHRYCFPVSGSVSGRKSISGVLHTVNPIANDRYPIYKENTREYCLIRSETFGQVLMMEVGALMVGKISNHPSLPQVIRGQEKGFFEFGGSTIVVLLQAGKAMIDQDILENSNHGLETVVKYGEKIGILC